MEYRRLGRSGMKVSLIGLGCNMLGTRVNQPDSDALVRGALDRGVTLFDVADIYGGPGGIAETMLGAALGDRRDEAVLATKAGFALDDLRPMGASRRYLTQAVEASLKRLGTDRIDLYQIHTPDPATPLEETMRALEDMQRAGKILYYGASNLAPWQVMDASWTARHMGFAGYASVQNEYHLLHGARDGEPLAALEAAGVSLLPYFPLASGLLTGKYRRGQGVPQGARLAGDGKLADRFLTPANMDAVERLATFAEERGRTLVELAFGWLAAKAPVASILAGATSLAQLDQNVAAAGWRLTQEEVALAESLASHAASLAA